MNYDGVVILCGASGADGEPAEGAVFPNGVPMPRFLGGGYVSLGIALQGLDLFVANEAQAGAYSYDMPGMQQRGYGSQLARGLMSTTWLDGTKSTAVVFDGMNDCLHSVPYTDEQADTYINNLKKAVNTALEAGKKVIVLKLAPYGNYDLYRALAPYGITEIISEINYTILQSKHEDAFGSRTDIVYLDVDDKVTTIDGLHRDEKSQRSAARAIKKAL